MEIKLHIPYAIGDPINGFVYDGPNLSKKEYVDKVNKDYYTRVPQVDAMITYRLGDNMSFNNYEKRRVSVKEQQTQYHICDGHIRGFDGAFVKEGDLQKYLRTKQQFGLMFYLNEESLNADTDMEIDLKMWFKESTKVLNINSLSYEERIAHLPKKDFKLSVGDDVYDLKNCKFCKLLSSVKKANGEPVISSFAMIIERIV